MIDLHHKFIALARDRKRLFNEMLAILPEIYESGVWRKYASDIYVYAGRFGGIARSTVEKRLRIEKDLKDKPRLREAIKAVGVHKVALIAKIADSDSDSAFADRVESMSKSALETLSKELKNKVAKSGCCEPTLFDEVDATPCHAKPETIKIDLDEEMTFLFLKLRNKYAKSNKETMRMILKKAVDGECPEISPVKTTPKAPPKLPPKPTGKSYTRHIPAAIKKTIIAKTAHRCAYPHCNRPGTVLHHRARFAENRSHDSLTYLCHDHHEFAHNGLIRHELKPTNNWLLATTSSHRTPADELYLKYRQR